jgi:hypothetical protein
MFTIGFHFYQKGAVNITRQIVGLLFFLQMICLIENLKFLEARNCEINSM